MSYVILVIGFVLLIKGADFFVEGSSNLAKALRVPTLIIGLTIVAFGTSAPEAVISAIASAKGSNEIAISNAVGSNLFNMLVVLGVSASITSLKASRQVITKDFLFSIFAVLILIFFTFDSALNNNQINMITRGEGLTLLFILGLYMYSLILTSHEEKKLKKEKHKFTWKDFLTLVMGLAAIIIGGEVVVNSAQKIAISWGVSETLVGLTLVSMGTSLPELVTSVVAVRKGETDIAIGNVIGSNIFNILFVLGISSTIKELVVQQQTLIDIIIVLLVSLICYILTCINSNLNRKKGIIMLIMYIAYLVYITVR